MYGEPTYSTGFRYLASIKWKGILFCSGTFVHPVFVLTTARCIYKIGNYNETDYRNLSVFFSITVYDIAEIYRYIFLQYHKLYHKVYNFKEGLKTLSDNLGIMKVNFLIAL